MTCRAGILEGLGTDGQVLGPAWLLVLTRASAPFLCNVHGPSGQDGIIQSRYYGDGTPGCDKFSLISPFRLIAAGPSHHP